MPSLGQASRASITVLSALAGLLSFAPLPAAAQVGSARYSSIVVDAQSGAVLQQDDADEFRHPASLAKLMTLYLTFEALRDRRISLDELVPVSEHAAAMQPTKLGLQPGTRISVEQAIMGLVTRSANDAAAALGEMLGGTENRFAMFMTLKARALGMRRSTFVNASGLPDPDAWTTARDMALLARRLITDFPDYYHYFSTPSFVFRGQVVFNHDTMLQAYPGADGLKTGYTVASGHNLVTSAVREGHRLIGVELGCASNAERDMRMAHLLNAGFEQEGVAPAEGIVMARTMSRFRRFPSLIASASAAESERHLVPLRPERHQSARLPRHWFIQVGSFRSLRAAHGAAARAQGRLDAGTVKVERVMIHGRPTWRARIMGLSTSMASAACTKRSKHHRSCVVVRHDGREQANL